MKWRMVVGVVLAGGCGKAAAPPVVDRPAEAIGVVAAGLRPAVVVHGGAEVS